MEAGGAGHKGRSSLEENLEPRHVTVNAGRDVMKRELYTRVTLPCLLRVFGFLDVDERSNGFGSAFRGRWEVGPFL